MYLKAQIDPFKRGNYEGKGGRVRKIENRSRRPFIVITGAHKKEKD